MARSLSLDDYLAALDPDRRAQVQEIRRLVQDAEPALVESMKWNAPNWAF